MSTQSLIEEVKQCKARFRRMIWIVQSGLLGRSHADIIKLTSTVTQKMAKPLDQSSLHTVSFMETLVMSAHAVDQKKIRGLSVPEVIATLKDVR